ncbi:MAG: TIGR03747 family integrating conjugative element membrane protein [Gammaproteobacteria bacterium]|nr:MAG: TIGR03747 family integrating conjugative element membrane protein [Gammaproteobacteria bacterium]
MASRTRSDSLEPNAIERVGFTLGRLVRFMFSSAAALLAGLVFSVIVEWVGMFTFWKDQGAAHAANMLQQELGYLEADFARRLYNATPRVAAEEVAAATSNWLNAHDGWFSRFSWLSDPVVRSDNTIVEYAKRAYGVLEPFISSAHDITVLYMVRLMIITFSVPLIMLTAFTGLMDGLCQRELRKDGGGRESATKFRFSTWLLYIGLFAPFIFYLASPFPTHPGLVLAPIALAVGVLVYMTASNYKKYW